MHVVTGNTRMSALLALIAGMGAGIKHMPVFQQRAIKCVRNYPMPVISPPEEIAAWNERVDQRKAARLQRRHAAWLLANRASA